MDVILLKVAKETFQGPPGGAFLGPEGGGGCAQACRVTDPVGVDQILGLLARSGQHPPRWAGKRDIVECVVSGSAIIL
jgi:hypothetical protein